MSSAIITVAVTGASGYLASHVIKALYEEGGFKIRGTVRDPTAEGKVAHLKEHFPELELFKADLLEEGSFEECFTGCNIVIHCASPFPSSVDNPQKELIEPALNGTKNVMNQAVSCGVARVVVTSSCAAVQTQDTFRTPEKFFRTIFNETHWNDESTLEEGAYRMSKSLAEHAAWEFSNQLEVTTINPSFILGPPLSTRLDSTSVKTMVGLLNGVFVDGVNGACFGCVDVRDVALAHVRAAVHPEAPGKRFVCSCQNGVDKVQMASFLLPEFANYPIPMGFKKGETVKYRPCYCSDQMIDLLGVRPRPLSITINEMAHDLIKKGLVSPPKEESEN